MSDRSCSAGRHQNGKYDGCRWRRGHVLRRHASDARGSHLLSGGSGRQVIGLSCRWLDGALRQQCAGHQPFERQATMNGGFSILPTGSTDPLLPSSFRENCHSTAKSQCRTSSVPAGARDAQLRSSFTNMLKLCNLFWIRFANVFSCVFFSVPAVIEKRAITTPNEFLSVLNDVAKSR